MTAPHDITRPLRLAVGSHARSSGKGCANELISWENGDTVITDLPACADPMLARIVQRVNDRVCTHREGDLLCPACSMAVLELGHRTIGTGTLPLTDQQRRVVWVKIAIDQARQVLHLVPDYYRDHAITAIEAAERWATDPSSISIKELRDAASAAYAAEAAYAANAAYAAYAYTYDASADASADAYVAAAGKTGARLSLAHRAVDLFDEFTQHVRVIVPDPVIADAYACMTAGGTA